MGKNHLAQNERPGMMVLWQVIEVVMAATASGFCSQGTVPNFECG